MKRRGKVAASAAVGFGLAILVGAGIAAKDRIREWCIHTLRIERKEERVSTESLKEEAYRQAVSEAVQRMLKDSLDARETR